MGTDLALLVVAWMLFSGVVLIAACKAGGRSDEMLEQER